MASQYTKRSAAKPATEKGSASRPKREKPRKPHPDYPLTANGNGQWSKKIRGQVHYFGVWEDPDAALRRYNSEKDYLLAGEQPPDPDALTVRNLVNEFLAAKEDLVDSGEITRRHWNNYHGTAEMVLSVFGKGRAVENLKPKDFEKLRAHLAQGVGPETLGNYVQRVRSIFKYAYDAELIEAPVRFGPNFKKPAKKTRRKARREKGERMFEAHEIRALIDDAKPQLKAMILLGINCGFGNTDIATLPRSAVDLGDGWHHFARTKTEVDRRCPLWPETVSALKEVEGHRPIPRDADHDKLVFVTHHGHPWVRLREASDNWIDSVGLEFGKLATRVGVKRKWNGFYSLRRTFRTVADRSKDEAAAKFIMGHADSDDDMSAIYRQRFDDDRLIAVTDCVHDWVFATEE